MATKKIKELANKTASATPEPPPQKPPAEEPFPGADAQTEAEVKLNAILEAKVAQAANKVLAGIPQAIDAAVENRTKLLRDELAAIRAEANRQMEEIKQAIMAGGAQQPAPTNQAALVAPGALGAAGLPPSGDGQLGSLGAIAQLLNNFMGGNKGSGSMAVVKDMFDGMGSFMDMTSKLYQGPRYQAQKEIIDIMKAGYGIGLDTKQVIEGAEKGLEKSAADIFKAKPSA